MSIVLSSIAPIWKVLVVGLVLGAGLPALFAVGMRLGEPTALEEAGPSGSGAVSGSSRIGSVLCFAVVGLVVVAGLILLAAPKAFLARFGVS